MKGSYHIRVSNRIISYEFIIHRNITILQGDSATEIYGIHSSGKYNSLQPVYHTFYRIYPEQLPDRSAVEKTETVVTEDKQSDFQFFSAICTRLSAGGRNILCRSAEGNSNIIAALEERSTEDKPMLVIADAAAFGAYMQQISLHIRKHRNVFLYLPESFEWLILKSGLIDGNRIEEILDAPENYIESRTYFSWERFFTELLVKETQKSYLQYQKGELNTAYLQPREMNAIIKAMPEPVKNVFTEKTDEDNDI